jgi:hypothetical protein
LRVLGCRQLRPEHPRKLPPGSIKHLNSKYGSWFAPRRGTSVDNANGITITSGDLSRGEQLALCGR